MGPERHQNEAKILLHRLVHFLVHFRHRNTHLIACATAISCLGIIVPKIIDVNLNIHPESVTLELNTLLDLSG